ncbi:hypothetical protein FYC62_04715 [Pedobacter aquae]|uniref:Uncharacterized protein n=2 Tax=Pedobacter aquae TaxID=2605747 RepID=A0A5C0VHD1_9SPHI|nr:hypothetical protein FYC62_04715 [Pedobacter aquae]
MKAKFLTTLFLLIGWMSFAQEKHLTFKDVPINGTMAEYISKMEENGFNHLATNLRIATLRGDFAGYKNCMLEVSTLWQKDLVHKIDVIFPFKETWSALYGDYSGLKVMLTEKYGKPTEFMEKFVGPHAIDDDRAKMSLVKIGNCKYYAIWRSDQGDIKLSIEHRNHQNYQCFVQLTYLDKVNSQIVKEKTLTDL